METFHSRQIWVCSEYGRDPLAAPSKGLEIPEEPSFISVVKPTRCTDVSNLFILE